MFAMPRPPLGFPCTFAVRCRSAGEGKHTCGVTHVPVPRCASSRTTSPMAAQLHPDCPHGGNCSRAKNRAPSGSHHDDHGATMKIPVPSAPRGWAQVAGSAVFPVPAHAQCRCETAGQQTEGDGVQAGAPTGTARSHDHVNCAVHVINRSRARLCPRCQQTLPESLTSSDPAQRVQTGSVSGGRRSTSIARCMATVSSSGGSRPASRMWASRSGSGARWWCSR